MCCLPNHCFSGYVGEVMTLSVSRICNFGVRCLKITYHNVTCPWMGVKLALHPATVTHNEGAPEQRAEYLNGRKT
jgi:hypothetical protein